jgi:membrane protein implicated in regulation of membrane protease activity
MRRTSGTEPLQARSAVRLRLVLALVGLVIWIGVAALLWWAVVPSGGLRLPMTLIALAVAACAAVSGVVAVVRLRQRRHGQRQRRNS